MKIHSVVQIRSADEISATLDNQACCDGLPWLPGMTRHCGKRYRISKHVTKLCISDEEVNIRGLRNVVSLEMPRCDGEKIGDCQMSCTLLWHKNWLDTEVSQTSPDVQSQCSTPKDDCEVETLPLYQVSLAETQIAPNRFRCQATQLSKITERLSVLNARQYLDDYRLNEVAPSAILSFFGSKLTDRLRKETHTGPCTTTPVDTKGLQVGDRVRVKDFDDIRMTLDQQGCNRGLWFDPEMINHCGRVFTVTARVERLIDEKSGALVELKHPSIVLGELACTGVLRRFCSRSMLNFWREIWLDVL